MKQVRTALAAPPEEFPFAILAVNRTIYIYTGIYVYEQDYEVTVRQLAKVTELAI